MPYGLKHLSLALVVLAAVSSSAAAADSTPSARERSRIVSQSPIIYDKDVPLLRVYQWEVDGKLLHAWPDEGKPIPPNAPYTEVKLYNFPTGQLRKLWYQEAARTVWHVNGDEIYFYGFSGAQVEFVAKNAFVARPGDTSYHPQGALQHSETVTPAVRAEFAFAPSPNAGAKPVFFETMNTPLQTVREEIVGGRRRLVTVPAGASRSNILRMKLYQFPDRRMIEAHYAKGYDLPRHINETETLTYVVSGRMKVATDTVSGEVGPGDMVRAIAGKPFARQALEDTVTVEIDGSKFPGT